MRGPIPRPLIALLALFVVFTACGDDDGAVPTEVTSSPTATDTTAAATSAATTAATSPPATTSATSAAVVPVPASEALAGFFAAAEDLDVQIKAAADLFNASFDPDTGLVDAEVPKVVYALNAAPLARLVPGGMTDQLEVAVLAVFADLDSRIAALSKGGIEYQGDLTCLGFGGESARRFPDDLAAARDLAATAPDIADAPGSPESGMVAARLAYINGSNTCCGSCGGYAYEEEIEIDWEGRIFGPGWINAPFVATFNGAFWEVQFPQAG